MLKWTLLTPQSHRMLALVIYSGYKTKAHEYVKGSRGRRPDGVEKNKGEGIRVTRVHHTHIWNCQRTALIKIIIKQSPYLLTWKFHYFQL